MSLTFWNGSKEARCQQSEISIECFANFTSAQTSFDGSVTFLVSGSDLINGEPQNIPPGGKQCNRFGVVAAQNENKESWVSGEHSTYFCKTGNWTFKRPRIAKFTKPSAINIEIIKLKVCIKNSKYTTKFSALKSLCNHPKPIWSCVWVLLYNSNLPWERNANDLLLCFARMGNTRCLKHISQGEIINLGLILAFNRTSILLRACSVKLHNFNL